MHAIDLVGLVESTEAIRSLRAHVEAAQMSSVLVVGIDADAKLVGLPLAVASARAGLRSVLIDADLRSTKSHAEIGEAATRPGLADWLSDSSVTDVPLQISTIPGLSIVTPGSGHLDPGDVLGRPRLAQLVPQLATNADRLIAVTAPLTTCADALQIARFVDGTILVVTPGHSTRVAAIRARDSLQAAGGRILGVVLGESASVI